MLICCYATGINGPSPYMEPAPRSLLLTEVFRHVQHQPGVDARGDEILPSAGERPLCSDNREGREDVSSSLIGVRRGSKKREYSQFCPLNLRDYHLLLPPGAEETFFSLEVEETGHVALPLKSAASTKNKLVQTMHAIRATLVKKCPPPGDGKADSTAIGTHA